MAQPEVPPGWETVRLGDVGDWGSGGTPSRKNPAYYGGDIPWLKIGDLTNGPVWSSETTITKLGLQQSSAKLLEPGTLLIAMYGSIGKIGVTKIRCATNQAIAFCRNYSNLVRTDYLFFAAMSLKPKLIRLGQGGTQQNISQTLLKKVEIPLPPFNEQRRIVETIETLFAELDKGETALREVQKLLARYRQSVLKAAVTGQLTADWRAENSHRLEHGRDLLQRILQTRRDTWEGRGKYKEPLEPDIFDLPDIPAHWVWVSLDSLIVDGPTNGVSPKETQEETGCLSFKLTATTSGRFVISEDTVKAVDIQLESDSKYWLQTGDVLVQRGNTIDYVGTAAIFPGPNNSYIYPDLMMRIRFAEPLIAAWAVMWVNFEFAKRHFRRRATGIAGNMPKINATTLKTLPLPLPPKEEMVRIFETWEAIETRIELSAASTRDELARAVTLRQSILKEAFAGRLVPQDPNDEPAADLLARIKPSRTAKPKSRAARTKKPSKKTGEKAPA